MAIVGERWGLFPKLKDWVAEKKPIWGTCAGMILLSDHAIKQAIGGQSLVGGLDVHVCRNFFGSQIYSCEVDIILEPVTSAALNSDNTALAAADRCPAVFIRAPAILSAGPNVDILATMIAKPHKSARSDVQKLIVAAKESADSNSSTIDSTDKHSNKQIRVSSIIDSTGDIDGSSFEVFVAVRQDNILATAFHPELTEDTRWHQ
jgi:pyridoxal 5'-phosphate synthase pdxT subunit